MGCGEEMNLDEDRVGQGQVGRFVSATGRAAKVQFRFRTSSEPELQIKF